MRRILIIYCLVLVSFCSCEKALSCLEKSKGVEKEVLDLSSFTKLEIKGNVDVELLYGDEQTVLEADRSMESDIDWEVENGVLKLSFQPTCKTLKKRDVKLQITTKQLDYILYDGQGKVYSSNVLKYPRLTLDPKEGVMEADLMLDTKYIGVETGGLSSFVFSGKTDRLWVGNYGGDGYIDASTLCAQDVTVEHKGTNVVRVKPSNSVDVICNSSGDVILYQVPITVKEERTNTGRIRYK